MKASAWFSLIAAVVAVLHASVAVAVVKRPAFEPRYAGAEIGEWTMDHGAALAQAKTGTNNVVVMFTGAWWCPHCQALENKVLTNQAWQTYVASNSLYLVMMDNPGRSDSNPLWCWLRETNYYENAGLTRDQAETEITNHYAIQTSFASPGAPVQVVKDFQYLKVGYPTLIVLRPDGGPLGRFTPLMTTVSLEMAIRNMNQILAADAWDELDDYHQGATLLESPVCEDAESAAGTHTLSETDAADWYAFDATNGVQWSFAFRATAVGITTNLRAQLFANPTNATSEIERVMVPSDISVLSYVIPKTGRYWLKVSRAQSLTQLQGYDLAYWYATPPATVLFAAPQVSVSERMPSVSLTVNITGAAPEAEVRVSYETIAGSAKPDQDYVPRTGELVWGAGIKRPQVITIPLLSDAVWEGNETFDVALYAVKNCAIGAQLSVCTVVLNEQTSRQPGKLAFEAPLTAALTEGSNAQFRVARTAGANGAVTARVDHVQGAARTFVAQLVWTNTDVVAKSFAFAFTNEPGFQPDRTSTLRLTPLGGAALVSTASGGIALTRRDDLVVQTLAEYAADPANLAFGLKAARGLWFCGFRADDQRDVTWLRSGVVGVRDSAGLSSTVQGPGVMGFDWFLDGSNATVQCQVGGREVAVLTSAGVHAGAAVAVPDGRQTVAWNVKRGTGLEDVSGGVRNLAWYPLPQTGAPQPADKAAVINRALTLSWQDVLAGAVFPAGVTVRYEIFAGTTSWSLTRVSEQSEPEFPRAGSDGDRAAFSNLIVQAGARPLYWRVDAVATDPLAHRAVHAGSVWSVTVLPEGSPEYAASAGGYDPFVIGGVLLPAMTVGVYGEAGPIAVANGAGGTLRVTVKNRALPTGVSAQVRDGAVWLAGVPARAGQGSADLHLTLTRKVGLREVTSPGTSVTVLWTVQALGRAAGEFNGHLVTTGERPGYGNASVTVTGAGVISGRFLRDEGTYSIAATAFGGRTNGAFFVETVARFATHALPVTLSVAENGSVAELQVDGVADSYYALRRNNWGDADGAALLRRYVGYYTVALPVLETSSTNAPAGTGYLTLTVKDNGTVSYAGQTADGESASGSAPLLYGPDCCSANDRVTFYLLAKPYGYGRADGLFGLVLLSPGEGIGADQTTVTAGDPSGLHWVKTKPDSFSGLIPVAGGVPEGLTKFTNTVDVTGGYYDRAALNLQTYYGGAPFLMGPTYGAPADFDGVQGSSGYRLFSVPEPARLPVTATGAATLAFPASVLVKNGTLVDIDASTNPWLMTVNLNRNTGIFAGACKFYYEQGPGGAQRTKTITPRGVFLPLRAVHQVFYADWMGFYLVADSSLYQDGVGRRRTYPFNWSFDFFMATDVDADK